MIDIKLEHYYLFKPSYDEYAKYILSNRLPKIINRYLSSTKRKHYWFYGNHNCLHYQCTIKRHKNKIVYT